jgi:hypothetical protein
VFGRREFVARGQGKEPLLDLYRDDGAYKKLGDWTKVVYDLHLNRMAKHEAWGMLPAKQLTPPAVKAARDAIADTPGMANQMLSVGSTF